MAGKSGATPIVIEAFERGIPLPGLLKIRESRGEIIAAGRDRAQIVVAIGDGRGHTLLECFHFFHRLGISTEGAGSGLLAALTAGTSLGWNRIGLALFFKDALLQQLIGEGHFFFRFVLAAGLQECAREEVVSAFDLEVIPRNIFSQQN